MIKATLVEIFSGDVPRIDNMVIVSDPRSQVYKSNLMSASAQVLDEYVVGFNLSQNMLTGVRDHYLEAMLAVLVRAEGGFTIESGVLPEWFQGMFFLEYMVSFREENLPADNDRVMWQVREIKNLQAELARGCVGSSAYTVNGNLWARVKGLAAMVKSLG